MRHASLFSGIGGFDLAAEWMGWKNVFQVEKDKFCQKVLAKNFPNVTRYGDIKEFDGTQYRGAIDIISGGFPCQPFSVAGKRKGKEDDRYLWPEMLRVISEVQPSFIVGENVTGIIGMGLEQVLTSLEGQGYYTETFVIPACAVNAPHRRDRIWIIAHSNSNRLEKDSCKQRIRPQGDTIIRNIHSKALQMWNESAPIGTSFCGVRDGISNRVDRIKGLGNAIVPQVGFEIFKAINEIYFKEPII